MILLLGKPNVIDGLTGFSEPAMDAFIQAVNKE